MRINHAEIVDINDFDSRNSPKDEPVIQLNAVDNIFLRNNSVSKDQAVFLKSQNLGEIEIQHNWLHSAKIIKE